MTPPRPPAPRVRAAALLSLLAVALAAGTAAAAAATAPVEAALDLTRWTIDDPDAKVEPYQGRQSLLLEGGTAYLKDVSFADGTVEVDIGPTTGMAFAGVVFRVQSADDCEVFYLRPFKSGFWDATQYTPRYNGIDAWQLYSGQGFTSEAAFAPGRWIHLKLTFAGTTARAYLDGADKPVLTVANLKRDPRAGSVGLWGLFGVHFANFRYLPAAGQAPAEAVAEKPPAAAPPGTITRWQISPVSDAGKVDVERYPDRGSLGSWETVASEPSGLVNLAMYRRKTTRLGVVYARVILHADRPQVRKLSFGYSDRVTVFLNGAPLYSADSTWRSRDPSFLGIVSTDHDAVFLDLREGDNELLLAITELFGGWGLAARLDATDGVTLRAAD